MSPLVLIGALALGAIAVAAASKSEAKPAGGKVPTTPAGGIDIAQYMTDLLNAMSKGGGSLTPDQLQRLKDTLQAMGVDEKGQLTTRPTPQAIANLALLATQLKNEGAPMVIWTGLLALSTAAAGLPQGTTMSGPWEYGPWSKVQGPWHYLGSLTQENRERYVRGEGGFTDISGFGDWWESFIRRWADTWKRGPYQR